MRSRSRRSRLLVLGWHNIQSTWCFASPGDSGPVGFRAQLRFLSRFANVLPLGEALAVLQTGQALPPRACALSFDDGYADNLLVAAPLLAELRLPATFFLVPGLLSRSVPAWWEVAGRLFTVSRATSLQWRQRHWSLVTPDERRRAFQQVAEELKRVSSESRRAALQEVSELLGVEEPDGEVPSLFLDWAGARSLLDRGFDVGSHSSTHPILATESQERVCWEVETARVRLQAALAQPVELLAYPNGRRTDYDSRAVQAAERAGHAYAVTTAPGLVEAGSAPFELPRCVVSPEGGVRELLAAVRQARGAGTGRAAVARA